VSDFQQEFPDFPAADMPAIPAGFVDTSWHNDVCPSFTSDSAGLIIWIDYLDPANREFGAKYHRFDIMQQDCGVERGGESLMTDDWAEVERFVAAQIEAKQARCQHRDDGRGRCIDCGAFL
jgi:hypothetical protein